MSIENLPLTRQFRENELLTQIEKMYRDIAVRINQNLGLSGSVTWNPGNIVNGANDSTTVTVKGAALGDYAIASFSLDVQDLQLTADVTAADTATVILSNTTGGAINLASGTVRVKVFKR